MSWLRTLHIDLRRSELLALKRSQGPLIPWPAQHQCLAPSGPVANGATGEANTKEAKTSQLSREK